MFSFIDLPKPPLIQPPIQPPIQSFIDGAILRSVGLCPKIMLKQYSNKKKIAQSLINRHQLAFNSENFEDFEDLEFGLSCWKNILE